MLGALGENAESTLVAFGHQVGKIGEAKKIAASFYQRAQFKRTIRFADRSRSRAQNSSCREVKLLPNIFDARSSHDMEHTSHDIADIYGHDMGQYTPLYGTYKLKS